MEQIDDLVYYDSNSDDDVENDDDTFRDAIQVEDVTEENNDDDDDDIVLGEPINMDLYTQLDVSKELQEQRMTVKEFYTPIFVIIGSFTTNHARSMVMILLKLKKL